MELILKKVHHRRFGTGMIVDQNAGSITVDFGEELGMKDFSYPFSFGSVLELCDPVLNKKMVEELRHIRAEETEDRQEEYQRRKEIKGQRQIEKKRAAAHRYPAKKSKRAGRGWFE